MESFRTLMPALSTSLVAMTIGATMREAEWSSLGGGPSESLLVSAFVLFVVGAVIGAVLAGPTWKCCGNRLSMATFDGVLLTGLIGVTYPVGPTSVIVVVGRLFIGIGSGALTAVVLIYVAEISNPKIRGSLSVLFPVILATGVVLSDVFGQLKPYDQQHPLNISFNVFCCLFVVLHAIGLRFVPKSPYSLSTNFFQHSVDTCRMVDALGESSRMEMFFKTIKTDYHIAVRRYSWYRIIPDALSCRANRRSLLIGVGSMFFHQMCRINVMTMIPYMNHIIKMSDMNVDFKTVSISLGLLQVIVMLVITNISIDKKGRRLLLIYSAVIMCIVICSAGLAFCIIKMRLNPSAVHLMNMGGASMILITFFTLAYSIGFGPVPWIIMGEIFSTEVKPYGMSLATAVYWLMVLASYQINMLFDIKYVFMVYCVLCLFGALFAWKIVPETKKYSLSQVQWEMAAYSFEVISYIPV